jgi:molecular chaperone DnaJ
MTKDYYKTLGVSKDATKEEIKKAYKTLAKKYHPDMNKDSSSTEKFKEINEAHRVLTDDAARENYDRFGTTGARAGTGRGGFEGYDFGGTNFEFDVDDIFDMFFGGTATGRGRRREGPVKGSDLEYEMEIELEDAAFGAEKNITIPRSETCTHCKGTGAEKESDIVVCDQCEGTGMVRRTQRTPFGMFSTSHSCAKCKGMGKYIRNACSKCKGMGRVETTTKIKVDIPAGVEDETRLRIEDEGEAGIRGGPSGDLYVLLNIKEHKIFTRKEDDIYVDVPVSFVQAAMGADIEVPTLEGDATLKIPSGTQTDTLFRMKGKGIQHLRGFGKGDQNVKVIVQVPEKLTNKQKELLMEFERETTKQRKGLKGFFSF